LAAARSPEGFRCPRYQPLSFRAGGGFFDGGVRLAPTSAEQAKGTVKEAPGKMVRHSKLEAGGKAQRAKGKIKNAIGGLKGRLRGR
jgi:uncharacterized protein YjbJ (UPF0337 family)